MKHTMQRLIGTSTCVVALAVAAAGTAAPALARGGLAHAPVSAGIALVSYPDPAVAGEPALLAGRVTGPGAANATVTLWQRPAAGGRLTQVAQINADSGGAFVFTRAEVAVDQSATLYATAAGRRSPAVHQQVAASVTLTAASPVVLSGSAVPLAGHVVPASHAGESVLLQQRSPLGWTAIGRATVASDGSFAVAPTFRGVRAVTVRALFSGDPRNLAGASDPLDLLVQSPQAAGLSLASSVNPVILGQSLTLSGTVAGAGSGGLPVGLLAGPDVAHTQPSATVTTDGLGNFSFSATPQVNTVYSVTAPGQSSAPLVIGVQGSVSLNASTLSTPLAATQVVRGSVTGAGVGGAVALQLLGPDGTFHTISRSHLTAAPFGGPAPAFAFGVTLTEPGSQTYRVLAGGDTSHESSVSAPLTVNVTPRAAGQVASALAQP